MGEEVEGSGGRKKRRLRGRNKGRQERGKLTKEEWVRGKRKDRRGWEKKREKKDNENGNWG